MRTLKIELSDELYEDLKSTNLDIQSKIKDYIANKISVEKDNYISYRTAGMRYWIIFLFNYKCK